MVEVVNIPISKLRKDPLNMREDPQDVSDLVEEVRKHGWTAPLEVRPLNDGTYGVVCGSRRLHAARVMGLEEVPCIVNNMGDGEALRRSMADNELHRPLTEKERVAYYKKMISVAGGFRAASRMFKVPKETMRELLLKHELLIEEDESPATQPEKSDKPNGGEGGGERSAEKGKGGSKLPKKEKMKIAKEYAKKAAEAAGKSFWNLDKEFLSSIKKDVLEKIERIESKVWEPRVLRRKPGTPALHEVLQKPSILEAVPADAWPLGWKPTAVESHGLKTLIPSYELGGDFSNVVVLLCPNCGHVLRGLGKGLPVVCLDCGFPSNIYGWKPYGGS